MGNGAPADWSRSEESLASVCQLGKNRIHFSVHVCLFSSYHIMMQLTEIIIDV